MGLFQRQSFITKTSTRASQELPVLVVEQWAGPPSGRATVPLSNNLQATKTNGRTRMQSTVKYVRKQTQRGPLVALTEEPAKLGLRRAISAVGGLLKALAVHNRNHPAPRSDQTPLFQKFHRNGDAGAANPHHSGEE